MTVHKRRYITALQYAECSLATLYYAPLLKHFYCQIYTVHLICSLQRNIERVGFSNGTY